MLGTTERCILMEEVLADVMSRWERYRQSTAATQHHNHHIFLFKVIGTSNYLSLFVCVCVNIKNMFALYFLNDHVLISISFLQKHLLLEQWIDLSDNVEKELLYFQVLYTLRADKFPVTQMEAVSIWTE